MKKNHVLVILMLIVLFLYLRPSTYAPIKYSLIQGPPLPELVSVPKSNKLLTNYKITMDNYLGALSKSYVSSPEHVRILKNPASNQLYESSVRQFIAQHNAYFNNINRTTDVCSWISSLLAVTTETSLLTFLINEKDPGLKPLAPFLGTDPFNTFLWHVGDNIYTSLGKDCF